MRLRAVRTLLRKELTDTLRDRRTLMAMVVLPVVLYPLLFIFLGQIAAGDAARARAQTPTVAVWGPVPEDAADGVVDALGAEVVRLEAPPDDAAAEARRRIGEGEIDLVLAAETASGSGQGPRGTVEVHVYHSEVEPVSALAFGDALEVLEELNADLLSERVESAGLPEGFGRPLEVAEHDVASAAERGGEFGGRLIPFLLLLMVTSGALFPAIDVTAGEKERGTMQTLLVAPVRPLELIASKYLTVVLVAVTSAVLNLGAVGFAVARQTASFGEAEGESVSFSLSAVDFLVSLGLLLPVAFLISALLVTVCVFGRSFREAQNYANPVMIVAMLAGLMALSDAELTPALAFLPLANIAMVIRDVLRGDGLGGLVYLVFAANALYALAGVVFASRVFESEQVLLGGERPWRDLRARRLGGGVPSGRSAVLFGIVLLVVVYYGSLVAVRLGFVAQILTIQLGLLLVPAVLWVVVGRHDPRRTLWLRAPRRRGAAGLLLVAAGAWAAAGLVMRGMAALFPAAGEYGEVLREFVGEGVAGLSWPAAVALVALLPAVCEEVCFRGIVLSGLRSTGTAWAAVLGSGVLFGLFHVSPFHAVPAAVLGAVFAYAVLASGSLAAGVAGHAVNNGIAVAAVLSPGMGAVLERPSVAGAALVSLGAGLWILRRERREGTPDTMTEAPELETVS